MKKKKQIVAHFNHALNKIIFYAVEDNKGDFTLLRKQGTYDYLVYDNDTNMYTKISEEEWKKWSKTSRYDHNWHYDRVFFWADSAFVTKYGHPDYNLLVETYKHLLNLREIDIQNRTQYKKMMYESNIFSRIKLYLYYKSVIKHQARVVRKEVKGLKVIW